MSGPGPCVAATVLRPSRRRAHVNPGSDFDDPPRGDEELIRAIDALLAGAGRFVDGEIGDAVLARLVGCYRAESARAAAAGLLAPLPRGGKGKP